MDCSINEILTVSEFERLLAKIETLENRIATLENELQAHGNCQIVQSYHSDSSGGLKAIFDEDEARNKGLTQGKLALVFGVASSTVGNWKDKGILKQKGWRYRNKRYYSCE
ncbi:MAG: hypothetical protein ACRC2R_15390 [Xenococcaceae cyanobacterium]